MIKNYILDAAGVLNTPLNVDDNNNDNNDNNNNNNHNDNNKTRQPE